MRSAGRLLAPLALALLALSAFWAWPRPGPPPPAPALRAVLLDASASITRLRPGWGPWARRALAEEARAASAAGQELLVVRYAAGAERLFGPGDPLEWLELLAGRRGASPALEVGGAAAQGTRLRAALELAAAELVAPGRATGELALLAEPAFTGPDPHPRLFELARAGIGARLRPPPAPEFPNLALRSLSLPPAPAAGEPLALGVNLELEPGAGSPVELLARAELRLELDLRSAAGTERRVLGLAPPADVPGGGSLAWSLAVDLGPAEPGWVEVRARALLVGQGALRAGDPIPEDDQASAATRVAGRLVGLVLCPPARRADLESWLAPRAWPGIDWVFREPGEVAAHLRAADLVLTVDVPLGDLPATWLLDFVERGGGGLFVCGGWGLLRQWVPGPEGPPLARHLPLVPRGGEGEAREVLFLVDGSGSMVGEPFDLVRRALVEMAEVAPPGDELALRFFTGILHRPVPLSGATPAERRRALSGLLGLRPPGGGTAILYSLEQLAGERAGAVRPGLAILLSDGLDRTAHGVPERAAALRRSFAAGGLELVVVAAGEDADLALLGALAGDASRLHHARDLSEVGEIFQREVNRERVREGRSSVHPLDPASTELAPARDLLGALARLPAGALPDLERYARVELAPGAAALLVTEAGEPLLAMQRVGAGLVAAFASAPLPEWAPGWRGAQGALGAVARALASGTREAGPRVTLAGGRLEVEGLGADAPPSLWGRIEDGSGRVLARRSLHLPVGDPGEDPRRRRVDAGPPLTELAAGPLLRVVLGADGDELAHLPLTLPPGEEWAPAGRLGALPEPAGAGPGAPGQGRAGDPRHRGPLAAGLAILFLAGLRRVLGARAPRPTDGAEPSPGHAEP